jgi:DNA-binding LacI/PurR family transcriptional regulator
MFPFQQYLNLRNSSEIGEETRLKVQAFAKFYHYRPNNIALSLKESKTKTIGIIIPEMCITFSHRHQWYRTGCQ